MQSSSISGPSEILKRRIKKEIISFFTIEIGCLEPRPSKETGLEIVFEERVVKTVLVF